MSSVLLVPIHLDALPLANGGTLVGPTADFTRLPYFNGDRDVNADVAYVSEDVVSRPFQNESLYLKAGVHLHWALPDALARGRAHANSKATFPAVPNRWLVIRSVLSKDGSRVEERRWIVESDYLYPEGSGRNTGSVNIPYNPSGSDRQSFRYLGRNMPLSAWPKADTSASYLKKLTAIGYGEPTFAAFYPNCHSVFGFHDDDYGAELPDGLRYDLIGWYSVSTLESRSEQIDSQDFLKKFGDDIRATAVESKSSVDPDSDSSHNERLASLIASLENQVGWTVALEDVVAWYPAANQAKVSGLLEKLKTAAKVGDDLPSATSFLRQVKKDLNFMPEGDSDLFPSQVVCFASLTFDVKKVVPRHPPVDPNLSIAVGNSGTEALSSFLAPAIDIKHKAQIEDQLEALLLSDHLEHRQLDIGFKFQEARHEKGFKAVSGGSLWTITKDTPGNPTPANATDQDAMREITLPARADELNALNLLQQEYDRSLQVIESLRRQLFSDWYKYMLSAYPPEDSRDEYPDADHVKHFIETKGLERLKKEIEATGTLHVESAASGAITDADASGSEKGSLAAKLAAAIKELVRSLAFDSGPEIQHALKYRVTDHAVDSLKAAGLPPHFITTLETLKSEPPKNKKEFLELVKTKIGDLSAPDSTVLLRTTQAISFCLKLTPGPRFWRPNAPVVLLSGAAAEPTDRHGQDGRLREDNLLVCYLLPNADLRKIVPDNLAVITKKLEEIRNVGRDSIAFETWTSNPWNPLFLEWEAEVFPVQSSGNLHPRSHGYDSNFITDNYELRDNAIDLAFKVGKGCVAKAKNVYVGSSILTPHAKVKIEGELERFFIEFMEPALLKKFYQEEGIAETDRGETFLLKHFPQLFNWYPAHSDVLLQFKKDAHQDYFTWALERINVYARFNTTLKALQEDQNRAQDFIKRFKPEIYDLSPFYKEAGLAVKEDGSVADEQQADTYLRDHFELLVSWYQLRIQHDMQMMVMLQAYIALKDSHYLSQSLGGFNQSLLMHRQTMQMAIATPLGFKEDQDFAQEVSEAVGNANRTASAPLNDFNPVASGVMRLNKLRLIDTFGQVVKVNWEKVTTTNLMRTPENDYLMTLPPRVIQPCRLNFRWLSAAHNDQEMNEHPATTPICGWVLPNHLDNSLAIFDNEGVPLGSVKPANDPPKRWQAAPGQTVKKLDDIENPHLGQMARHLLSQSAEYLNNFITAIDSAVDNIEPENFAQHQALALLIGCPLALVRASLQWELQGLPAINQSWEAFRLDLNRLTRKTDRFTSIEFPIRIGEHRQLNDGVVGYWREKNDRYEKDIFYAPQSNRIEDAKIVTNAEGNTNIPLALDSEPQVVSMLIDPRGVVHATSGIVPTKVINIPPDQYAAALHAIQVTFLTAPVLTNAGEINLPLPDEHGYRWSWIENVNKKWSKPSTIVSPSVQAEFRGQPVLREGWLKLSEAEENPAPGTSNVVNKPM